MPTRYERSLGAPITAPLDDRTYAFDGDLYNNQGISVEIDNSYYDLAHATSVLVPTIANIINQIAADPTLTLFDPLTAAHAETEPMKCRLITPSLAPASTLKQSWCPLSQPIIMLAVA